MIKIPPYLKKGEIIGITSPAGYITPEEIQPAVKKMEEWGYKIKVGDKIEEQIEIEEGTLWITVSGVIE